MVPLEDLYDKHAFLLLSAKSITIQGNEGYGQISIDVLTGTVDITGVTDIMGGETTGTITIAAGKSFTIGSGASSVDDVTIDATNGSANVMGVKLKNPL